MTSPISSDTHHDQTAPIEPVYDIDPLTPMPHVPNILPPFPLKPHSDNPTPEQNFISETK